MITITNEDNMDLMARYPDGYFDLAIVDPPYGINSPNMAMGSHPHRSKTDGFGSGPGISTAVKLKGTVVICPKILYLGLGEVGNNYLPILFDFLTPEIVLENIRVMGFHYPSRYCLYSIFYSLASHCQRLIWENFSQFELAWTSFDRPAAKIAISTTGGSNREKKIHPTQKPVKLYKWQLDKYARSGDKILDTHYGSGSIGIACYDYGFDLVACEKDTTHYSDAMVRFKNHTLQGRMFLSNQ